jgi:hypothetical protein
VKTAIWNGGNGFWLLLSINKSNIDISYQEEKDKSFWFFWIKERG